MRIPDDALQPWRTGAAYLYTLELDGPALAWEYLRRHPGYRADWRARGWHLSGGRWGLRRCPRPRA